MGLRAVALAVFAAGVLSLILTDPSSSELFPSCVFHHWTGIFCPGCGTTRALHALLTGHPVEALSQNPLAVVALPFLTYAAGWWLAQPWAGDRLPAPELHPSIARLVLPLVVGFWILRNIPGMSFLAPGP